ncbi:MULTISPECIES: hypothetical protein [Bradyrhizobium]|uniref:Uncharacterized protein n=1 Tax=Bradyrhizobium elkanii TaxID=29448 RepID=A0A8I2C1E1_BRAEL|nr:MULTISPECIES: hypothetical protein [Bradyrhizobium]MBP1291279.1 hypothetical protein [Bradyrhizobium elkanii]MCP1928409.1 hypothetical protein [Bradyrhizobium elkanii]MCS3474194.1 hypothetical protein [Bradyrhizobium elkanii]MCS3580978.1 hypothetical protein [Bradyrhizobium elkanii]MCS3723854.1 hypothetical protein [Bradyrhizobium elkanii]
MSALDQYSISDLARVSDRAFNFKARIGVLSAKRMPIHCHDRQPIGASCKGAAGHSGASLPRQPCLDGRLEWSRTASASDFDGAFTNVEGGVDVAKGFGRYFVGWLESSLRFGI